MYQKKYHPHRLDNPFVLEARFYAAARGSEPVRDWLKSLPREARHAIGEDIKVVQIGWPLGMPTVRKLAPRLWEVRTATSSGGARVLFTTRGQVMVLLHGFIKKSQKTPASELALAVDRCKEVHRG